jgi:hypothetical protein
MKPNNVTDTAPTARMTKSEANRKNAHKFSGPKTPRGKSYSRSKALKHGLYSKELVVSEADQPEFQDLRTGLKAQLKPSTVLQRTAFDYIVACNWRCKLAMRLEQRQFARQLQDEQDENPQSEAPDVDGGIKHWYGCSRLDTRAGIRALEYAMKEFDEFGYFREETRKFLKRGFGADFLGLLEEWTPPMSKDAMLIAQQVTVHRETFGGGPNEEVETSSMPGETTKVVLDPMQGRHMVCKLLEERRNFLQDLLTITDTLDGKPGAAQSSDFNPRFLADANRELRRALEWYLFLKDKGL